MKSENITDWVAEFFLKQNIDRVFLYPGGTIAPLVNACIAAGIKIENFKNEQGAGCKRSRMHIKNQRNISRIQAKVS